jgi:hypothetical protein
MESMNEKLQTMESATPRNSSKGSKEGSSQGELLCLEAPQGATGQNPGSENIESLTERSALLVSMVIKGIGMVLLRGKQGRLGLQRLVLGNPPAANLGCLKESTIYSTEARYIWGS